MSTSQHDQPPVHGDYRCSNNNNHHDFNKDTHKCRFVSKSNSDLIVCDSNLERYCVSCKKWSSSSNFPKRHSHQPANNTHQTTPPTTTPTTHQTTQFINHGGNQQINPFVINITIGDPIRERILLTTKHPTNVINNQSNATKNVFLDKLLNWIKKIDCFDLLAKKIMKDEQIQHQIDQRIQQSLDDGRLFGARQQQREFLDHQIKESIKERGLFISSSGAEKIRKMHQLESNSEPEYGVGSRGKYTYPSYYDDRIIDTVIDAVEVKGMENKSLTARYTANCLESLLDTVEASELRDIQCAIDSLRSSNGGFYVSNIIIEHLECSRDDVITGRGRRTHRYSSLNIPFRCIPTKKQKANNINMKIRHEPNLSDDDIKKIHNDEGIYVGQIEGVKLEDTELPCLKCDLRTVLGLHLMKLYDLGCLKHQTGEFQLQLLHWSDCATIAGSKCLVCCVAIDHDANIFTQDQCVKKKVSFWHVIYIKMTSETKESTEEYMNFRHEQFRRLEERFVICDGLFISFRTTLFIGDLSFLLKSLSIHQQFCGHCVLKSFVDFMKAKQANRRTTTQMITDGGKQENGQQKAPNFSIVDNDARTICDVLHSLKGTYETLEVLLVEYDGVPQDIFDDIKCDVLGRNSIELLSGGQSRLFFVQYENWLPKLQQRLSSMSIGDQASSRLGQVVTRFQKTVDNLEWVLFTLSEISRLVYMDEECKQKSSFALTIYLEVITFVFAMSLNERYGTGWLNKHTHGVTIHFCQDFALFSQRTANCERGEYLFSVFKRIALIESNRHPDNILLRLTLGYLGIYARLMDDTDSCNYTFSQIQKKVGTREAKNLKISLSTLNDSRCSTEWLWFINVYLKERLCEDYDSVVSKDLEQNVLVITFHREWSFSTLNENGIMIDQEVANSVQVERKETKSCPDCGCSSHSACSLQQTARCKFCCLVHRFQCDIDDSIKCGASSHNMSMNDFVDFYHKNRKVSTISAATSKGRKKEEKQKKVDEIKNKLEQKRCETSNSQLESMDTSQDRNETRKKCSRRWTSNEEDMILTNQHLPLDDLSKLVNRSLPSIRSKLNQLRKRARTQEHQSKKRKSPSNCSVVDEESEPEE